MKLTYLGTAAAEGVPGIFCNCSYCREARLLCGKNIRTRSQALINDDLLIDFPADSYSHFLKYNIEGDSIKYLLITHSHSDHFYPNDFNMRVGGYAHDMHVPRLQMYCSEGAFEKMNAMKLASRMEIDFKAVAPFDAFQLGDYTVTALPARHAQGDGAVFYIIRGEKTVLYAHDTGYFYDEVFEYIENMGIQFDLISMDCTNIDIPISDEGNHMGIANIERAVKHLEQMGAVTEKTQKIINHFSHNAAPIHHKLEARVASLGYVVSYDGLSIDI